MKTLLRIIGCLALVLGLSTASSAQNYTTVTASSVGDGYGTVLANGTICFQATNLLDAPVAFSINGIRQVTLVPVCGWVSNGVIMGPIVRGVNTTGTLQIANPSNTLPAGIVYRITVTDLDAGTTVIQYKSAVISGSLFNFDQYVANPTAYNSGGLSWNAAATIAVGTVTTTSPGTSATVTNIGNSTQAVFNFQIPQGPAGPAGPPGTGTVDTNALHLNTGTPQNMSGAVTSPSVNYNYAVDGYHYTTVQAAINQCLADAATAYSANNPWTCLVDATGSWAVSGANTFGNFDHAIYCPSGVGAGSCSVPTAGTACTPSGSATCTPVALHIILGGIQNYVETDTIVYESAFFMEGTGSLAGYSSTGLGKGTAVVCTGGTSGTDPCFKLNQAANMEANHTHLKNLAFYPNPGLTGAMVQNGFDATIGTAIASGLDDFTWENVWWGIKGTGVTAFTGSAIYFNDPIAVTNNPGTEEGRLIQVKAFRANGSTNPALYINGDVANVKIEQGEFSAAVNADTTNAPNVYIGSTSTTSLPYNIRFEGVLNVGGKLHYEVAGLNDVQLIDGHDEGISSTTNFMQCEAGGTGTYTNALTVDGENIYNNIGSGSGGFLFDWTNCSGLSNPRSLTVTHTRWGTAVTNVVLGSASCSAFIVFRDNYPDGSTSPSTGMACVEAVASTLNLYSQTLVNLTGSGTVSTITSSLMTGETLKIVNSGAGTVTLAPSGSSFFLDPTCSSSLSLPPGGTATFIVDDGSVPSIINVGVTGATGCNTPTTTPQAVFSDVTNATWASGNTYQFGFGMAGTASAIQSIGGTSEMPVPRAASVSGMQVKLTTDPGSGNTVTVTVYVNANAPSTLVTCTITGNGSTAKTCSDTTHTLSVSLGQYLTYAIVVTGSGFSANEANISALFQ